MSTKKGHTFWEVLMARKFYRVWLLTVALFCLLVYCFPIVTQYHVIIAFHHHPVIFAQIFLLTVLVSLALVGYLGIEHFDYLVSYQITLLSGSLIAILVLGAGVGLAKPSYAFLPNGIYSVWQEDYQRQAFQQSSVDADAVLSDTPEMTAKRVREELGGTLIFFRTGCRVCQASIPKLMEELTPSEKAGIRFINIDRKSGRLLAEEFGIEKAGTVLLIKEDGDTISWRPARTADDQLNLSQEVVDLIREGVAYGNR